MMKKVILGIVCALSVFATASTLKANEELADLHARLATLEAKMMAPAGGGDAESLTSLRKKGAVKIGGAVELDFVVTRRDEANSSSDQINRSFYRADTAELDFQVDAGTDTYFFTKLDLNSTATDGTLLDQIYFVWENARGSNWSFIFGKNVMPFGQDKNSGIFSPFVDGDVSASVLTGGEAADDAYARINQRTNNNTNGGALRQDAEEDNHESQVILASWGGEIANVFGAQATYKYKELATFEIAAFQNTEDMHEDRSDDNGLQSWATRLTFKPMENLTLSGSFANQHTDAMDSKTEAMARGTAGNLGRVIGLGTLANRRLTKIANDKVNAGTLSASSLADFNAEGPAVDDDQMTMSLAFDYMTKDEKWNIYGEWIYGWHMANYEELSSHVGSFGVMYALNPKIGVFSEANIAHIENGMFKTLGINFTENIYNISFGSTYTCDNGISFTVHYLHEWYNNSLDGWDDGEGDAIAFRTSYEF